MLPVLFRIGDFAVHSYGVALGAGLFLGIWGAVRLGVRAGMPASWLWDLGLVILAGAVVGSRAEYVRTHWSAFAGDPLAMMDVRAGGLVFYGGLVAAILGIALYCRWRGLAVMRVFDTFSPMVALGHAIGRLGCLAAGCCFGRETDVPWALVFPPGSQAPAGVPLHPTQLYEVGFNALLCVALLWLLPRRRYDGQVFAALLVLYPAFRMVNETLRGDEVRGTTVLGLTNGEATSLALGAVAALVILTRGFSGWPGTARRDPAS